MTDDDGQLLAELQGRLARVEDDLRAALDVVYEPPPIDRADPPVPPAYDNVHDWVTGHFVHLYARHLGGEFRWCASWWDHAEALSRLEALWRAWETLRLNPGLGMATWYRDHLDPQLPILLGQTGPFARCTPDRHTDPGPLPVLPAPHHYWDANPAGATDVLPSPAMTTAPVE